MGKKQVSLRIDEELIKELDELKGTRTEKIEDALQLYIKRDTNVSHEGNQAYVSRLEDEINYLRSQVNELTRLLSQEQSLHLQTQQQLEDKRTTEEKQQSLWQRFVDWFKE